MKVYNLLGQEVAVSFDDVQQAGNYVAAFDSKGPASSVYVYGLSSDDFVQTKKLVC